MKFRIVIGSMSTVEKPFIIQYKKFLFWRTFKHWDKFENKMTVPYFTSKGAEDMLAVLEGTLT